MSEMQDAVQVIRVTYEGLEMFFKVGSGGYRVLSSKLNTASSVTLKQVFYSA